MKTPESQEKMQVVVGSLRDNPDVVIVGGFEKNYLASGEWPHPNGYWSKTLEIYTHPTEQLNSVDEYNDFMLSLVPEVEPSAVDNFMRYDENSELRLGKLYYDEKIGSMLLSATVILDSGLSVVTHDGLEETWTVDRKEDLKQRTWVRVYPTAGHALDAAQGINEFNIPANQLGTADNDQIVPSLYQSEMLGKIVQGQIKS